MVSAVRPGMTHVQYVLQWYDMIWYDVLCDVIVISFKWNSYEWINQIKSNRIESLTQPTIYIILSFHLYFNSADWMNVWIESINHWYTVHLVGVEIHDDMSLFMMFANLWNNINICQYQYMSISTYVNINATLILYNHTNQRTNHGKQRMNLIKISGQQIYSLSWRAY